LKYSVPLAAILLLVPLFFAQTIQAVLPSCSGKVLRVYDGDTIKVEKIGKVRLLGIDTPERESSDRDRYYLRRGVCFETLRRMAAESREFVTRNASGVVVTLTFDSDAYDRHGRLLAYVYLPDGRLLNRMLLEAGLASVYRRFDFNLKTDFIQAEKMARSRSLGLWADVKKCRD